jgi:hypothetical protein
VGNRHLENSRIKYNKGHKMNKIFLPTLFIVLLFLGCSNFQVPVSSCDSLATVFSLIGKTICESYSKPLATTALKMSIKPEINTLVYGNDTLSYTIIRNVDNTVKVCYVSTSGISGTVFTGIPNMALLK